jgi:hypothetical protein
MQSFNHDLDIKFRDYRNGCIGAGFIMAKAGFKIIRLPVSWSIEAAIGKKLPQPGPHC